MDISNLKLICYDEADEIFLQGHNHACITAINAAAKKLEKIPQSVLFSATFTDAVIKEINKFFERVNIFTI